MQDKKQLTFFSVTVEQNVWLADIIELCILGLGALEQLGATVAQPFCVSWCFPGRGCCFLFLFLLLINSYGSKKAACHCSSSTARYSTKGSFTNAS